MLLTVKSNQKTLHRQIGCQFQGRRHIPFTATDQEKRHGRDSSWELQTLAEDFRELGEKGLDPYLEHKTVTVSLG